MQQISATIRGGLSCISHQGEARTHRPTDGIKMNGTRAFQGSKRKEATGKGVASSANIVVGSLKCTWTAVTMDQFILAADKTLKHCA